MEADIKAVREAHAGTDTDSLRRSVEKLNESMQKIGQAVYSAQGTDGAAGTNGTQDSGRPAEEGTVEGEFREV